MITVLCGGVGAARLLKVLSARTDPAELIGIVNTGDDLTLHGLRICPDLDTITYTLAGLNNEETGWGLAGETWRVMAELGALGGENWFSLGDRDLATHLYRTQRLAQGAGLSEITAELSEKLGCPIRLLPVTEDTLATMLETPSHGTLSFQEYFVGHHHSVPVSAVRIEGAEAARPAPGVLEAIRDAERIVIAPSNPLISLGPLLAVPGITAALEARRDDVVAISPLIGGQALKGPADRLLDELGHGANSAGVAALYAPIAGTLLIDATDADERAAVEAAGLACVVGPTLLSDPMGAAHVAEAVLGG
jgi:LPPG:FO 2-phospho-L-lactate transferase